jgi:hypothetical protein
VIRIANASGFYGDRPEAFRELLETAEIDVITGDYLSEITMLILARDKLKDPSLGYAKTFVRQYQDFASLAAERGVRIVVNAGGLNPAGLAARLREITPDASIGYVEGDDLTHRAAELDLGRPLTANAYLGAFGITECLKASADIVVTGRVTDASLVVGAAAAHFGWTPADLGQIAGAMAAGHVIECGTQATGGNYAFFTAIKDMDHPGFPIAEVHPDGSSVITKAPGSGGAVTTGTVTAQLLYEVTGARYAGPDAVLRLDTIRLTQDGTDRVRISDVRGEAPPATLKVGVNSLGGFRNQVTFVLTGLDIDAKAELVKRQMPPDTVWTLARTDHPDAAGVQEASALLHGRVTGTDADAAGRRFSDAAVHLALGSYPGFTLTTPPGKATPFGEFRAAYVPAPAVPHAAILPNGDRVEIGHAPVTAEVEAVPEPAVAAWSGRTRRAPLGLLVAARSGDKGKDANVGVWVEDERAWPWLAGYLSTQRLRQLLPETAGLEIERHVLPNLRAVNFVIRGLLAQRWFDPQAKALGEQLRARHADVPEDLI